MKKSTLYILTLFILAQVSCVKNYIEDLEEANFSRILKGPENVEAVDFIIKPDNSGFLVLGNSKTINNSDPNSNFILFDLDRNGYLSKVCEIQTNFFDEGEKLYLSEDNRLLLVGTRIKDNNQKVTFLIESDLNGTIPNFVEGESYPGGIEIAYNETDINTALITKDVILKNGFIVIAGYLEDELENTNALARSYNYTDLMPASSNSNNYSGQIPLQSILDNNSSLDGSKFKKIDNEENSEFLLSIYGDKSNNGNQDISNYYVNDIARLDFQSPTILVEGDQELSCLLVSDIDQSMIFAGTDPSVENSIYFMRGRYNLDASKDSVGFNLIDLRTIENYGSQIVDLTQSNSGEIYALLVVETPTDNIELPLKRANIVRYSFLLNGTPQSIFSIDITGNDSENGIVDSKRIQYQSSQNALYVLSSVVYGTDERAIELSKIKL